MQSLGVSVVICCYNSIPRLPNTLKHLAQQKTGSHLFPWEVIIIDNGSTDDTATFAQTEWKKYATDIPLYVIPEPRPGTALARETGIKRANFEYVLFCDDDNWLVEDYIDTVYTVMSQHPYVSALGGQGVAECEIPAPAWFDQVKAGYAIGPQAGKATPSEVSPVRAFLYTAGSAFRRSAVLELEAAGYRNVLEGRTGKNLAGGEDTELCYNMILHGYRIFYDSRLTFVHFMTSGRLNYPYYLNMLKSFGRGYCFLMPYKLLLNKQFSKFNMGISWLYISAFYLITRAICIDIPKSLITNNYHLKRGELESHIGFLENLFNNHKSVKNLYTKLRTAPWIKPEYLPT